MDNIEQKLKNRLRIALNEQSKVIPKDIKIGDVYISTQNDNELYDKMVRYLGLCGKPYQIK